MLNPNGVTADDPSPNPPSVDPRRVRAILRALRYYPHYAVVGDVADGDDPEPLVVLVAALCNPNDSGDAARVRPEDVSFTRVRVDASKASNAASGVTFFSRTSDALPAHTDSSYMARPHELMALQCVHADENGGDSIVTPLADILRLLDEEDADRLREPIYPFGEDIRPILFGAPGDERLRYYRNQIDRSLADSGRSLAPQYIAALDALDRALETFAADPGPHRFRLAPGQILLMHNHKALHGRTGFAGSSDRLLYRVRQHADTLRELASATPTAMAVVTPASEPPPAIGLSVPPLDQARLGALLQAGDRDGAIDLLRARLRDVPSDVAAHVHLARLLARAGHIDEAIAAQEEACRLAPDDSELYECLGEWLIEVGRFEEAERAFEICVKLAPDHYDNTLTLSSLVYERDDRSGARALVERAVAAHPIVWATEAEADRPTILRTRGFESSAYRLNRYPDGHYGSVLKGGHFSLDYLLDDRPFNLALLNILDENVDRLDGVPAFDLLLNTISCPDRERSSLLALARFLSRHPEVPVINHPRAVLQTARERNAQRLGVIPGMVFPHTERLSWTGGDPEVALREMAGFGFRYPMILRCAGSQTGLDTLLARDATEARGYFASARPGDTHYAIQFHDVRRHDGLFHKARVFFIDGRLYPVAYLHHADWSVHSGDRYSVMQSTAWTQEEERAFIGDPIGMIGEMAYSRLHAIRDVLQLDFFGVDFTTLEDGRLYVFEANAAMRHNFDHVDAFPYTGPNLQRISAAFQTMVERRLTT